MAITHVVQQGDSLWALSLSYKVSVEAIRVANNLLNDQILIGQVLTIPVAAGAESISLPEIPMLPSIEGGFLLPEGEYSLQELEDISLLARLVYAEAKGEPYEGQIAVAAVLLNRLKDPGFPNTVREAIYQPRQFEVVSNGTINQTPDQLAYEAVLEARNGVDPTVGSLFFWNPSKVARSSWVWTREIKLQIGDHVFA